MVQITIHPEVQVVLLQHQQVQSDTRVAMALTVEALIQAEAEAVREVTATEDRLQE